MRYNSISLNASGINKSDTRTACNRFNINAFFISLLEPYFIIRTGFCRRPAEYRVDQFFKSLISLSEDKDDKYD